MENKDPIYCVNAFHTLSINSVGSCKMCCMAEGGSSWNKRVKDTSIDVIWEDRYFLEIRKALSNGERHPACKKCWEEEDAGRDSKRIRDNKRLNFKPTDKIKAIELNLGNTCNIQCRTCHPYSSSKWLKEYYATNKLKQTYKSYLINSKTYNDSWDDDSLVWSELDKIGKDLERIEFYGGEPFLIKQQWKFLKKCVDEGWSKNQVIHYNSNGTTWNEENIELFNNFKLVEIGFSIDGLRDQFEFMRYLAKWDEVLNNLEKAKKFQQGKSNMWFDICHTISSLNVYYIPEFIEFFGHEWRIYLNLVHWPNYYAITIFPDKIKELIIEKLNTINEKDYDQIVGIKNMIANGKFDNDVWQEYKRRITIHDEYRNQDYYSTFPEFGKIIRDHG
jgi:MoaA/NifB/PqqE/SkfB family radical SAM enzyme